MLLHWWLIFKHSEKFSNIILFFQLQLNWAPLLHSNGYVLPAAHPQQSRTFQGPCDFPLCFPPPISQNHQAMWPQGYFSQGKYNKQALRWSAAAGRTTQCVKQEPDYTCRNGHLWYQQAPAALFSWMIGVDTQTKPPHQQGYRRKRRSPEAKNSFFQQSLIFTNCCNISLSVWSVNFWASVLIYSNQTFITT